MKMLKEGLYVDYLRGLGFWIITFPFCVASLMWSCEDYLDLDCEFGADRDGF